MANIKRANRPTYRTPYILPRTGDILTLEQIIDMLTPFTTHDGETAVSWEIYKDVGGDIRNHREPYIDVYYGDHRVYFRMRRVDSTKDNLWVVTDGDY